jgi:hypothetical protein
MASFEQSASDSHLQLSWQVGLETDIGGGRENQDDCFVWIKRDDNIIVLCVLDGHGREVGKVASESAKQCLFKHLDENFTRLMHDPADFLIEAHAVAHEHIRNSFRSELTRQGYEVTTTEQGFLMKRRQPADNWACVHGGTSCSLMAVVGDQLYIANVGDSTGILCSSFGVLTNEDLGYVRDAAVPAEIDRKATQSHVCSGCTSESQHGGDTTSAQQAGHNSTPAGSRTASPRGAASAAPCPSSSGAVSSPSTSNNNILSNNKSTLVVTAEHSPECPYEYARLLRYRQRDGNAQLPALVVVYDSSSSDKTRCSPVFERDASGHPRVTNKGR